MASDNRLWFRAPQDQAAAIKEYAEREHDGNVSDALRELTGVGLEIRLNPLMRWRSAIRNAVTMLVTVATAIVVVGVGTAAIARPVALQVGALLLVLSASVLAVLELGQRATTRDFRGDSA